MSGSIPDDPTLGSDPINPLEQSLDQSDVGLPPEPVQPAVYKALPGSRVPVSSKRGLIWKARKDQGQKAMGDLIDAWDEATKRIIETGVLVAVCLVAVALALLVIGLWRSA
jgi:hypothetical protein